MGRHAKITVRETHKKIKVNITSDTKPDIIDSTISKWQMLIDTLARIIDVPSGLIMRLNSDNIEVFLKSDTEGNPYEVNEKAALIHGLYCETVIGTQKPLMVSNAHKSKIWSTNNPDVDINMISYLGVPLNWPDGECFGTVCVLDNKENHYSRNFVDFITQIKQHIELDLENLLTYKKLKELNEIKSKFLSLISHDLRGNISSADNFLKLILENYPIYDKSEIYKMLNGLSENLSNSHLTLDNLLGWSKNVIAKINPEKTHFNIVKSIEQILEYFSLSIALKKIGIKKNFDSDNFQLYADKNMLEMSIRNIVSNAIKYSQTDGTITINLRKSGGENLLEIIDTGIGMNEHTLKNLFRYDETHQKSGTDGESSAGIGLILTKEFLDKNDAKVVVESEIDKGTKFSIRI